jgi:hypothetical protein
MGFIGPFIDAVVDIIVAVVDIIVQIVEAVIEFIMMLLGYDDISQTIEYFEVHNFPLFDDPDRLNPLLTTAQEAILGGKDIAGELIYASAFQSYKGDIQKFMNFIDDGNYIEGFPQIESYITYPDYTELSDTLGILKSAPCTIEQAYTKAPTTIEWVEYWLQENKSYSYENKTLPNVQVIDESTSPASTSDSATAGGTSPNLTLSITDEITTSDAITGTISELSIDLGSIVYNSSTNDYSVDANDDSGASHTLPYTIPSKPIGLHYVSIYYVDSAPVVTYLFLYKVGTGTYPDLDDPQNEININNAVLQAIPAIPLRLDNADYTTRPAEEVTKIEDLCDLISINAEELIDAINNDPDAPAAGDLDHVYITFGVRLWDTSQTGMSYLFTMCENLFPAQGSTQGNYDGTPSGDTKPVNNILITSDNYTYGFQFNYISYEFTTLAVIDSDSGSDENGYYYSDLSRFYYDTLVQTQPGTSSTSFTNNTTVSTDIQLAITDSIATSDLMRTEALTLKNPYYVSSGKGTYNVGYKASTLTEVANFLTGSGTVNPGTTTAEAANWLQVTTRMNYNNTTPVLQDANGSTSALVFLTPDLVYENNGAGVLRHVNAASEETTSGQNITYYRAISSGLEAYTMAAPIASLRVVDGDSGKFKVVKFNLGAPDDLMAPFIHNFIASLSNKDVTQLFLAGCHASMYIAHYEVIVQRTGGFGGILVIIVIIVILIVAWYVAPELFIAFGANPATTGTTVGLLSTLGLTTATGTTLTGAIMAEAIMTFMVKMAVSQIVKMAFTAAFGDSAIGNFLGSAAGMLAAGGFSVQPTAAGGFALNTNFDFISNFSFEKMITNWSWMDTFKVMVGMMHIVGGVLEYKAKEGYNSIQEEMEEDRKDRDRRMLHLSYKESALDDLFRGLFDQMDNGVHVASMLIDVNVRTIPNPMLAEHIYLLNNEMHESVTVMSTAYDDNIHKEVNVITGFA